MPKVVAIHRLTLNADVDPAAFEEFVQSEVFPGLSIVFGVDKSLSHGFTKVDWRNSEHLLLRPGPRTNSNTDYLWMISAPVDEAEVSTDAGRRAVEEEAVAKAQNFFALGSTEGTVASIKLKPFAAWMSLQTYVVAAARVD